MKINEIAFICYPVKSISVAKTFYEDTLKLKATKNWVQSDTSGFVEYDIGACTLAIGAGAPNFVSGKQGPTVALEVDNFDTAIKQLKAKKVTFIMEPADTPVCQMAMVEDPDGNQVMIHKRKAK